MASIKFGHTSDWHLGRRHFNLEERYVDNFKAVNKMVLQAIKKKIDFVIHAGDLFDQSKPTARTYNYTIKLLHKLQKANIPIFVVRGNHDASPNRLKDNALDVLESAGVITYLENKVKSFEVNGIPANIYGLGFVGSGYGKELEKLIEKKPVNPEEYNILLLHASVSGMENSDGRLNLQDETQAHFGSLGLWSRGFNYIGLGHHHRLTIAEKDKQAMCYSGATEHWNVENWEKSGEYTTEKQWLQISVENNFEHKIRVESFKIRPKFKIILDFANTEVPLEAKNSIKRIRKLLGEVNTKFAQTEIGKKTDFKPMVHFDINLGFNLADHGFPFREWKEEYNNILTKASVLNIRDKQEATVISKEQSQEDIIDKHIGSTYKDKKEFYLNMVSASLRHYQNFKNSDEDLKELLITELSNRLEEKLNA